MWNFMNWVLDIKLYFPEYTSKRFSINYLFYILGVLYEEELKEHISNTKKKRSIYEEPDVNQYVEATKGIKNEFEKAIEQKSKYLEELNNLELQKVRFFYAKE